MPHSLMKVCGEDQEGTAGQRLAKPLVVLVSDENGAAMAGVAVSFTVTAGEGMLLDHHGYDQCHRSRPNLSDAGQRAGNECGGGYRGGASVGDFYRHRARVALGEFFRCVPERQWQTGGSTR